MIFNILPKVLLSKDVLALKAEGLTMTEAVMGGDARAMEEASLSMSDKTIEIMLKILPLMLYLLPILAILTVLLLLYSNWAVKGDKANRWPLIRIIYTAVFHLMLGVVKLVAFCMCFIPGVFVYVKLYFVPLIMLDENASPIFALRRSWELTRGNFWELLLLIFINSTYQLLAAPTIIGLIPATGYANTVRAAAYQRILVVPHPPPEMPRVE